MKTETEKERIETLEDALCRANFDIGVHWQVRGEQMEEIVRLRELVGYITTEIIDAIISHGSCECDPESGDNPCEYCAAKHVWNAIKFNKRLGE